MTRDEMTAALAKHGPAAIEAAHQQASVLSQGFEVSLSYLDTLVSFHLRRAVLLDVLRAHNWNLTRASEALHMGGSGNVLRTIRDLALTGEYHEAKAKGLVRVGARTKAEREASQ